MQLGYENMRVVASVTHKRQPLLISRQVPSQTFAAADQELVGIVKVVQVRLPNRSSPINALQVEARLSEILESVEIFGLLQGRAVVSNVMGNELAEERPARRYPWILIGKMLVNLRTGFQWTVGASIRQ